MLIYDNEANNKNAQLKKLGIWQFLTSGIHFCHKILLYSPLPGSPHWLVDYWFSHLIYDNPLNNATMFTIWLYRLASRPQRKLCGTNLSENIGKCRVSWYIGNKFRDAWALFVKHTRVQCVCEYVCVFICGRGVWCDYIKTLHLRSDFDFTIRLEDSGTLQTAPTQSRSLFPK